RQRTDVPTVRQRGMSSHNRLTLHARHVMTRDPLVVRSDDAAEPLLAVFEGKDFNALPVVDADGELLGMVAKAALLRLVRVAPGTTQAVDPASLRVRDIMDTRKVWVDTTDTLDRVVHQMARYYVRGVPVIARSGGRRQLVGIVSYKDLRSGV